MKRRLITIHKWLGLLIGVFWLLQGLSGAFLSFAHNAEDALRASQPSKGDIDQPMTVGLREGLERAKADATGRLDHIEATGGSGRQFLALFETPEGETRVDRIDTRTGDVVWRGSLSEIGTDMSPVRLVQIFHIELLAGETGHLLIGISGIMLFTTLLMGAVIAWPRRGAWKAALRPPALKYKPGPLYAWHKAIGLWVGALLVITSFTGATLIWLEDIQHMTGTMIPQPDVTAKASLPDPTVDDIIQAIETASAAFPGASLAVVDLPAAEAPYYRVRLRQPEETRRVFGTTTVFVAADNSAILMRHDPVTAPFSTRIINMIYSLHTGEIAKLPGRIVMMTAGLSLAALVITSFALWLRKRPRRRV